MIFDNPKSRPPARIERWNLRLQGYDFKDTTSQTEEYVNFHASHAVPKAMSITEIQQVTAKDRVMQSLVDMIRTGKFEISGNRELAQFEKVNDELTVNDEANIIMRDNRIVMPTSLRERAVALAHEGHQGLETSA